MRIVSWYDTMWGYSNRIMNLLTDIVKKEI